MAERALDAIRAYAVGELLNAVIPRPDQICRVLSNKWLNDENIHQGLDLLRAEPGSAFRRIIAPVWFGYLRRTWSIGLLTIVHIETHGNLAVAGNHWAALVLDYVEGTILVGDCLSSKDSDGKSRSAILLWLRGSDPATQGSCPRRLWDTVDRPSTCSTYQDRSKHLARTASQLSPSTSQSPTTRRKELHVIADDPITVVTTVSEEARAVEKFEETGKTLRWTRGRMFWTTSTSSMQQYNFPLPNCSPKTTSKAYLGTKRIYLLSSISGCPQGQKKSQYAVQKRQKGASLSAICERETRAAAKAGTLKCDTAKVERWTTAILSIDPEADTTDPFRSTVQTYKWSLRYLRDQPSITTHFGQLHKFFVKSRDLTRGLQWALQGI
ncbi:hypothetical protein CPB86DRAFT_863995 [Serendipita vermifera]|nr:hypothetical protein CPB86DRAFT_863995 [Serendipita vermifera]